MLQSWQVALLMLTRTERHVGTWLLHSPCPMTVTACDAIAGRSGDSSWEKRLLVLIATVSLLRTSI